MKTSCFDAAVDFIPAGRKKRLEARILIKGKKISASFQFYEQAQKGESEPWLVRVHIHQPLSLKWKDDFEVQEPGRKAILGKGCVLNPDSEKVTRTKIKRRVAFLESLRRDEKDLILGLARKNGAQGIREKEIHDFSSLAQESLLSLAQQLEEEGKVRILSFSPLFLVAQESLDFLFQRIMVFLERFHQKHPQAAGVSLESIQKRFVLHPRILSLALKYLQHTGQIKDAGGKISLSGFKVIFTPEDKKILGELEEMCLRGQFRLFSLDELRTHFRLSPRKLDSMLAFLIEKNKIVQGKDGLLLHSQWLDEIIHKVRKFRKKELSVADFKEMTGLTRKYVIPLLELLDQMGVTRRKGSFREVL